MDEATGIVVAWLKHDQSVEGHQRQGDRARARRSVAWAIGTHTRLANALPREFHRRSSIQSTRRGVAARAGKR